MLGKIVTVTVDRPLGSYHPDYPDLYYPVNYGYIEGTLSADDEEIDAYVLGIDTPRVRVSWARCRYNPQEK